MSPFRVLLQLQKKSTQEDEIRSYWQQHEVLDCEYAFEKDYDRNGYVLSDIKGGTINLTLSSLPTDLLMDWVFDYRKFVDGEITMLDKVKGGGKRCLLTFEQARCVKFKLRYSLSDTTKMSVQISINTPKMVLNNTEFINKNR
jgi:hypothetical protein